jgi:hypothetical protein
MLLRDLDALGELEDEKRRTRQDDPRLVEVAARIEEIAGRILAESRQQLSLSKAANASAETGTGDPAATIESTPRNVSLILAEWRAAERAAQTAVPGSVEEHEARSRADRLRDEYRGAFDQVRRQPGA